MSFFTNEWELWTSMIKPTNFKSSDIWKQKEINYYDYARVYSKTQKLAFQRILFLATNLSKSWLAKDHGSFVPSDNWVWGPLPNEESLSPANSRYGAAWTPFRPRPTSPFPFTSPQSPIHQLPGLVFVSVFCLWYLYLSCQCLQPRYSALNGYSRCSVDICWKSRMDEKSLKWENWLFSRLAARTYYCIDRSWNR